MDFNGNVTIKKTQMETTVTKCVNGIYTCGYNATFYDVDHNNITYEHDFAVKLTHQSVTGLSSPTITSSTPTSSKVISTSPSSTTMVIIIISYYINIIII